MRLGWLLLCILLAIASCAAPLRAQFGVQDAPEETVDVDVADAEEAIEDRTEPKKPDAKSAIIQLDVWMLTLSADAEDDLLATASEPLADREEAMARVRKLQDSGAASRSHHFMATTLENEKLIVQFGAREPRVQATNITQFGKTHSLIYEPVGTMLQARARVDDVSRVLLEMQLESSHLEDSGVAMFEPKEDEPVKAPQIAQRTYHSSLACPSGGAVVALSSESQSGSEPSAALIYVAAKVMK
jgi:hypothetical protein